MKRDEILKQITDNMGFVPDWLKVLPEPQLEHMWGLTSWFLNDSRLRARDKALVAFGAASATHCPY